MQETQQTDSVNLFFQNFADHLRRMRDEGSDANQSYRAQILLSQLQQFQKAILEYNGAAVGVRMAESALQALMSTTDLPDLVHWLQHRQKLAPLSSMCLLNAQGEWERVFGDDGLPEKLRVASWMKPGLAGLLDEAENASIIYVRGAPRIILCFEFLEGGSVEDLEAFTLFVARLAPIYLTSHVAEKMKPLKTGLIARDPVFTALLETVARAAEKNVTILLEGESGTGKEVVAQFIHDRSPRKNAPMVTINCAAIPAGLIESELFGHEKGAFTGAVKRHLGCVERAAGGTLFLDEIGEMEISMQAKLLRFLQLKEFHRVGGRQKVSVDVRIIAATNRDLKAEIEKGMFREDLYYRLSAIPFYIPPLRDRVDDIIPLVHFFLEKYSRHFNMDVPEVDDHVFQLLACYQFPGNIRELENLIQKVLVLAHGKIMPGHLPPEIRSIEPKGQVVVREDGSAMTWRRKISSTRIKLKLRKQESPAPVAAPKIDLPWNGKLPVDNEELKTMKQQIQDFAKNEMIELEKRFLIELMDKSDGSIHHASINSRVNRTLIYKMLERTGLKFQKVDKET